MQKGRKILLTLSLWLAAALAAASVGCHTLGVKEQIAGSNVPRELEKVSIPAYLIEPPDILLIDALRVVPKPPYRIQPLDALFIQVENVDPEAPIGGIFGVEPEGTVRLGPKYGSVKVTGMTVQEAAAAIEKYLKETPRLSYKKARAFVSLDQLRGVQQIHGEHLVRLDGTVDLGLYGKVYVTDQTPKQAKATIETHLSQFLLKPEVTVSVAAYNSKVYYVITDGAGFGEQVFRLPITGNETVLDAVSQINGLPVFASRNRIWLARPGPAEEPPQILPIDWKAITRGAERSTNYQLLPGDRIYVQAEPLEVANNFLARIFAPAERIFGITLLGNDLVESLRGGFGAFGFGQ